MVQLQKTIFYHETDSRDKIYQVLTDAVICFTRYRYDRHKFESIIDDFEADTRLFIDNETKFTVIFRRGEISGTVQQVRKYSVAVEVCYEMTDFLDSINYFQEDVL